MDEPEKEAEREATPIEISEELDLYKVIPAEAARAHLKHWWREPLAGMLALGVGVFDSWKYGHDAGLSSSLDEILVIGGVILIAGSKRLFTTAGVPRMSETAKARKEG